MPYLSANNQEATPEAWSWFRELWDGGGAKDGDEESTYEDKYASIRLDSTV